jgi:hypothetical protein
MTHEPVKVSVVSSEAIRNLQDFRSKSKKSYQIQVNLNLVASICHS